MIIVYNKIYKDKFEYLMLCYSPEKYAWLLPPYFSNFLFPLSLTGSQCLPCVCMIKCLCTSKCSPSLPLSIIKFSIFFWGLKTLMSKVTWYNTQYKTASCSLKISTSWTTQCFMAENEYMWSGEGKKVT